MKFLIVSLLIAVSAVSAAETVPLTLTVREVKDADTIGISALLPPPLNELDVRLNGVDTPEMPAKSYRTTGKLNRAECVQEAELALLATEYVKEVIAMNDNKITIVNYDWGKYGGRLVADVLVGDALLANMLLTNGFAQLYDGTGERPSWCD